MLRGASAQDDGLGRAISSVSAVSRRSVAPSLSERPKATPAQVLGPAPRPTVELPESLRKSVVTGSAFSRELRRREQEEVLLTTVEGLDRVLHGGLPRGAVVELVGRRSCGRFATLMASLAGMTATGSPAALVDLGDHLDPRAAAEAGVVLERLLWVRPRRLPDAVAAAEDLVAAGLPLVAVDLGSPPVRGRPPAAAWVRLARRALAHRAAVLVSSPYQLSGWAAEQVVRAGRGRGRWTGMAGGWRLLQGLGAHFVVVRRRGSAPGDEAGTELVVADECHCEERPQGATRQSAPLEALHSSVCGYRV